MRKRKKSTQKHQNPLDMGYGKRGRGRPAKIPASTVIGRAGNSRIQLNQIWKKLEGPLLSAQTVEEVVDAFENHGQPYASYYVPNFASDVLALIRDKHFPKDSEARINFVAESLGGRPALTFRSSRDICGRERAKQRRKSPYRILRHEYHVECSCGYKGPALNNACRKCGAEISALADLISDFHDT